jgi:hypothetical protein
MTDLLSFLARDPSLSLAFNYASLLLNTSFFLEGLVKDTSAIQEVPGKFQGLEDQLVAQARGMVGNGWLWVRLRDEVSCCLLIGLAFLRSFRTETGSARYQHTARAPFWSVIGCNRDVTPRPLSTTQHRHRRQPPRQTKPALLSNKPGCRKRMNTTRQAIQTTSRSSRLPSSTCSSMHTWHGSRARMERLMYGERSSG